MRARRLKNAGLIADCDRLIQQIAVLSPCAMCPRNAEAGHHIIGRSSKHFIHDLRNILPVCDAHHTGTVLSPHKTPNAFKRWLAAWDFRRYEWWQENRNTIHKAPDKYALIVTRDRLREFLTIGKPFVWTSEEKDNERAAD